MANKLDPRVDSDRIGGHGNTTGAGGYGTGHSTGLTGSHGNTHVPGTTQYGSDPTGPHDSRMANKLDPRVDSDRIGGQGNTTGAGGYGTGHSNTHVPGTTQYGSDPTGPHDSRMANKLDPRVDSDRIGGQGNTVGAGGYGHNTGLTGGNAYGQGTTAPVHDSYLANKADPRVDASHSGYGDTTRTTGGGLTGTHHTGPASETVGPHSSNLANKLDPRVDSDLDGSRRVGGDRTFG